MPCVDDVAELHERVMSMGHPSRGVAVDAAPGPHRGALGARLAEPDGSSVELLRERLGG